MWNIVDIPSGNQTRQGKSINSDRQIWSQEGIYSSWESIKHLWWGSFKDHETPLMPLTIPYFPLFPHYTMFVPEMYWTLITEGLSWNIVFSSQNQIMFHDKIGKNNYGFNLVDFSDVPKIIQSGCTIEQLDVSENQISTSSFFFSASSNKSESSTVFCSHPTCRDEMTTNMTHCIWPKKKKCDIAWQIFLCLHNVKLQWQKTVWGPIIYARISL